MRRLKRTGFLSDLRALKSQRILKFHVSCRCQGPLEDMILQKKDVAI